MGKHASTDIEELFVHASSLEGRERASFIEAVRERDTELATMLAELLSADESAGARVPQDPRLSEAQVAAQNVMEGQSPVELDAGSKEILDRVSSRENAHARYTVRGEIGRGGMGAILEVWDEDLQRKLAMKVALNPGTLTDASAASSITIARFVEEAQVTGQLDHPGIVPVHELGLDAEKRVFFTMRYVRGRPLDEIFELMGEGHEGWNLVRGVGVMLKVCEAMGYAHSKGVVHRDLKPPNIMIGRFGEVYVMDWGVARVVSEETSSPKTQPKHDFTLSLGAVRTARAQGRDDGTADPLMTRDGSILGTPYFMPVEQAAGDFEKVDSRSDIYAVGAMLYQILTGLMPYQVKGQRLHPHAILAKILNGPPRSIHSLAPGASAELSAICNKAMARNREDRYVDMIELGDDLRAYLENRVVRAYATGPLVELRKWVMRNKAVAAAGILAFLLVLAGGAVSFLQAKRLTAEREARDYKLFLDYAELEESALRIDTSEMWPVTPDKIPIYDEWLKDVEGYLEGADEIRSKLAARRESGRMTRHVAPESIELRFLQDLAKIESDIDQLSQASLEVWGFDDPEDVWLHNQMTRLERAIAMFEDPIQGLIHGTSPEHGWGVAKRRDWAARVEQETLSGDEARELWELAVEEIAISPKYGGLVIEPQLGLLPLGPGPVSRLWEFCLLQTGEAPTRDAKGFLELEPETGLILVLLPGGTFTMGAQSLEPGGVNYDREAVSDEGPPFEVTLRPFFISKYEMNQAQWHRIAGHDPSVFAGKPWNPVERVRWGDCVRVLAWVGCTLPTEAQWEYAARSGTSTPWWTGRTVASLEQAGNLADRSLGETWIDRPTAWRSLNDGVAYMARADRFTANRFGLHGVIGNVWEWCLDEYTTQYAGDPIVDRFSPPIGKELVARGGSYMNLPHYARHANRSRFTEDFLGQRLGVRPARKIEGEIHYEQ